MRNALKGMIGSDPELRVIGTARDGVEALEKVFSLKPDIVTLDVTVCHERAAMCTATVKNAHLVIVAHDNEIDVREQRITRRPVVQVIPFAYGDFLHLFTSCGGLDTQRFLIKFEVCCIGEIFVCAGWYTAIPGSVSCQVKQE